MTSKRPFTQISSWSRGGTWNHSWLETFSGGRRLTCGCSPDLARVTLAQGLCPRAPCCPTPGDSTGVAEMAESPCTFSWPCPRGPGAGPLTRSSVTERPEGSVSVCRSEANTRCLEPSGWPRVGGDRIGEAEERSLSPAVWGREERAWGALSLLRCLSFYLSLPAGPCGDTASPVQRGGVCQLGQLCLQPREGQSCDAVSGRWAVTAAAHWPPAPCASPQVGRGCLGPEVEQPRSARASAPRAGSWYGVWAVSGLGSGGVGWTSG